jgi:hypothetical protein
MTRAHVITDIPAAECVSGMARSSGERTFGVATRAGTVDEGEDAGTEAGGEKVSWYIAEENDTPDKIAMHFRTVSAEQIVELNRARFPGLTVASRLRKNAHIKLRNGNEGVKSAPTNSTPAARLGRQQQGGTGKGWAAATCGSADGEGRGENSENSREISGESRARRGREIRLDTVVSILQGAASENQNNIETQKKRPPFHAARPAVPRQKQKPLVRLGMAKTMSDAQMDWQRHCLGQAAKTILAQAPKTWNCGARPPAGPQEGKREGGREGEREGGSEVVKKHACEQEMKHSVESGRKGEGEREREERERERKTEERERESEREERKRGLPPRATWPLSVRERQWYLKKGLTKLFKGYGYFEGTVEEYYAERDVYKIVYVDDDEEEMKYAEMKDRFSKVLCIVNFI